MSSILYLGLEVPKQYAYATIVHYPIIQTIPRPLSSPEIQYAFQELPNFTHLIFTSKTAITIFFDYLQKSNMALENLHTKMTIVVGKASAEKLAKWRIKPAIVAAEETAEGLVKELLHLNLQASYVFWPHSALSRPILTDHFHQNRVKHYSCIFYDTCPRIMHPLPNLDDISEIVFTSPSTVQAFRRIFGSIPNDKKITCIGPITEKAYLLNLS